MIICHCNNVSLSEIKSFLKKHPEASLAQLIEHTTASTKCGRCKPLLEKTHQNITIKTPVNNQLRISF